jgi:hypothetical protein
MTVKLLERRLLSRLTRSVSFYDVTVANYSGGLTKLLQSLYIIVIDIGCLLVIIPATDWDWMNCHVICTSKDYD